MKDVGSNISLALWGPSSGGKTVLLAQLYSQAGEQDVWQVYPTDASRPFVSEIRSVMDFENRFPPATTVGVVEPVAFRLRHRVSGVEVDLIMEDRAGKDYEEGEESAQQRLAEAAGVLLVFDPQRARAALEREVWETLENLHVGAARGAKRDERPIAVCLSKADLLLAHPGDLERARAEPDTFVRERLGPNVLRALDRFCARYRLFPVSSTGVRLGFGTVEPVVFYDQHRRARICPEGGMPLHLMAPFDWLLQEIALAP